MCGNEVTGLIAFRAVVWGSGEMGEGSGDRAVVWMGEMGEGSGERTKEEKSGVEGKLSLSLFSAEMFSVVPLRCAFCLSV